MHILYTSDIKRRQKKEKTTLALSGTRTAYHPCCSPVLYPFRYRDVPTTYPLHRGYVFPYRFMQYSGRSESPTKHRNVFHTQRK